MSYTPPPCDAADFTVDRLLVVHSCNAANFSLLLTSIGFIVKPSIITIGNKRFYFTEAAFISSKDAFIDVYSEVVPFQAESHISSNDSIVEILNNTDIMDILPDCISKDSLIILKGDMSNIKRGELYDLPLGTARLNGGGYSEGIPQERSYVKAWNETYKMDELVSFNIPANIPTDVINVNNWNSLIARDNFIVTPVELLAPLDEMTDSLWLSFFIVDDHVIKRYEGLTYVTDLLSVDYNQPSSHDVYHVTPTRDSANKTDFHTNVHWNAIGKFDVSHTNNWGPKDYFSFCFKDYAPPICGQANFRLLPFDPDMIGICREVVFDLDNYQTDTRCGYQYNRSGRRDSYMSGIEVEVRYPYITPVKEAYYMLNTVLVKRLPDNIPIEVTSVGIRYDQQSWLWQFTIGIKSDTYLELLKPVDNVFMDIEISINNWKWVCRVEGWQESSRFATSAWTLNGRSPSMELGTPQNINTSYIYDPDGTAPTSGAQIIEDILTGTILGVDDKGWRADWYYYLDPIVGSSVFSGFSPSIAGLGYEGWGFPPGTFEWKDKTQIEVVKSLAESIGAFIITNPNCYNTADKKLFIRPFVNIPPWHWTDTNDTYFPEIDHYVNVSYSSEIGRNYESSSPYNAVYVMGQKSTDVQQSGNAEGIVVTELYRDGVGPDFRVYAPDVVDPNLTSWQACVERGRAVLGQSGKWVNHTLRLFSLADYNDETPNISRLLLPGDFIQVQDKNSNVWHGVTTSVSLDAASSNGVFSVYQTVEVKRYVGA